MDKEKTVSLDLLIEGVLADKELKSKDNFENFVGYLKFLNK